MKNDGEDTEKARPDTHFHELPGIGDDRRRKHKRVRDGNESFAERDIFKDPAPAFIWKACPLGGREHNT